MNAATYENRRKLTSRSLLWHLNEEANSIELEDTINKTNEVMLAAMSKNPRWKRERKGKTGQI